MPKPRVSSPVTSSTIVNIIILLIVTLAITSLILSIISLINSSSGNTNTNPSLKWIESSLSPIYNPYNASVLDEDYFPYVLYDSKKFSGHGGSFHYKMYHQGTADTIALSYSDDGITWQLFGLTNLVPGFHPCVIYSADKFGGSSQYYYKAYFWTGSVTTDETSIKQADSLDGITWVNIASISQNPSFPLITGVFGTLLYHNYGPSFIYFNPSSTNISGSPFTYPFILFYDVAAEGIFFFTIHHLIIVYMYLYIAIKNYEFFLILTQRWWTWYSCRIYWISLFIRWIKFYEIW